MDTAAMTFALAHRASWMLYCGPIPAGMNVLHRCDVPPCVRPDHLFLGTQQENVMDMHAKGRGTDNSGERNPSARLTVDDVLLVRKLRGQVRRRTIAAMFGVSVATVDAIFSRKLWSSV